MISKNKYFVPTTITTPTCTTSTNENDKCNILLSAANRTINRYNTVIDAANVFERSPGRNTLLDLIKQINGYYDEWLNNSKRILEMKNIDLKQKFINLYSDIQPYKFRRNYISVDAFDLAFQNDCNQQPDADNYDENENYYDDYYI